MVSSFVCSKSDLAWDYFALITTDQGKKQFQCLCYGYKYQGEGIDRTKYRYTRVCANITTYKKVLHDVREQVLAYLNSSKKEKQECEDAYKVVKVNDDEELQELNPPLKH